MATRKSYEVGVTRREEILDAALDLFGEVGYHGASLRQVSARAGMSHPGLLHHFPTKQALLAAVLAEREARSAQRYSLDTSDPIVLLRGLIALTADNTANRGLIELYCVLSAEATAPAHPAHDYFVNRYRQLRLRLVETFVALQEAGMLRDGVPPTAAANAVLAHADGLQLQWLLEPDAVDMPLETRMFLESLVTVSLAPEAPERR